VKPPLKRGGQSWTLSILLHVGIVVLIAGGWYWAAHRQQPVQDMGIEARVLTTQELNEVRVPPPEPVAEAAPVEEIAPPPDPEPDPGPSAEELAAQARAADEARVAEENRIAAERETADRKLAAEKAERERKDQERREQAARDKAAKEKAAKDAREKAEKEKAEKEERERVAREKAEQEAAEKARLQRETELASSLAAEERLAAVRASGLQGQYMAQIAAKIERNWNKPPGAVAGLDCEVRVTQVLGGTVTGVTIGRCNGDETVRRSIEDAVNRASPLPAPPDPALFDRNIRFNFRPK
jgi:colicin import membrane protein